MARPRGYDRAASVTAVLAELRRNARPDQLPAMARYGLNPAGRLGVPVPALRELARRIGRDHRLALALWSTGIQEARIVASMIADPATMPARDMNAWVRDLDSWDVCDQACMNLFERSPLAWGRVRAWTGRRQEFVRRAGFVLLARLAQTDRGAPQERFLATLPALEAGALDDRTVVKKAVSWALRRMARRSPELRRAVKRCCLAFRTLDSRPARWIAADVLRELDRTRRRP